MLTIAVTGGVASGKTAFCRRFSSRAPEGVVSVFSCDEAARSVLGDAAVQERISEFALHFGRSVLKEGVIDRETMRELLFENSGFRGKVEGVVHPLVLQRVAVHLSGLSEQVRMTLVEVPLLYEVDFPIDRDLDLVVAASESVQCRRLLQHRGLGQVMAERILRSQVPMEEKVRRAEIVVWNDGGLDSFEAQTDHLLTRCETFLN